MPCTVPPARGGLPPFAHCVGHPPAFAVVKITGMHDVVVMSPDMNVNPVLGYCGSQPLVLVTRFVEHAVTCWIDRKLDWAMPNAMQMRADIDCVLECAQQFSQLC